ncbi:helix-turn-helix domain protein [bacterium BMS3Bbin08]|nr:helix-turn-helix domain protein [bacterium BMS3Bbin08]
MQKLWTPPELAEFFSVTVKTVYRWVDEGVIYEVIKLKGSLRFTQKEVDRLIKAKKETCRI